MAAAPLGSAEGPWTEDKERTLIAFFSQNSCLWNHRSENYKNRHLRWKTLERLRVVLSAQPPPAPVTVDDIKNKFKNLRTTFQRQVKQVTVSRASGGDVFQPQWKHYQQLMFLLQDDDEPPPPSPQMRPQDAEAPPTSPGVAASFLHTTSASLPGSSAGDAFNTAVKSYWNEDRERQLIAFYADHRCLWNKRCENHNNRLLRMKLLETLRQRLSDQSVTFSVDDIKSKFKNLRTVFHRELKSVQYGRVCERPYTSKWKHYQQLLFLCESCDEDDASDDKDGDPSPACTRGSSAQINSGKSNGPTSATDDASVSAVVSPYPVFIPASPDRLKPETGPASPPEGPPTDPTPLTADSHCYWTEDKVEQLIRFYAEHGCLWDLRSERYSNRLLRRSLLETLSGLLSENQPVPFTVDDIKTKFRNLRTIFRREHRAASANKTCGSEDFYLPQWRHYRDLMFLCDSCDEDEQQDQLRLLCPDSQTPQGAAFTAAPPSATPPDSRPCSPSPSTSSSIGGKASAQKRPSQLAPPAAAEAMELIRTLCQGQASPHAGFLKYVEECLNETPPDKVKRLKKKIIETIHSESA